MVQKRIAKGRMVASFGKRGRLFVTEKNLGFRSRFTKGLSLDQEERADHIRAMKSLLSDPDSRAVHSWLHENLTILDFKSQAILTMLSLGLATLTIFYASLGAHTSSVMLSAVFLQFALLAWAIVPLARVSFVYWNTTEEFLNPDFLLTDLLVIRDKRTRIIRIALAKCSVSLVLFLIMLAWDMGSRL